MCALVVRVFKRNIIHIHRVIRVEYIIIYPIVGVTEIITEMTMANGFFFIYSYLIGARATHELFE